MRDRQISAILGAYSRYKSVLELLTSALHLYWCNRCNSILQSRDQTNLTRFKKYHYTLYTLIISDWAHVICSPSMYSESDVQWTANHVKHAIAES